jgi:aspartyl-tRNA(Asn)/glutamyl-tRNA(Gln) amidotransferase subunit C
MLNEEELKALERLSRLRLSEGERSNLLKNLQNILNSVASLSEIDTQHVEPCLHVLEEMQAPLREDESERNYPRELFLKTAPEKIAGMLRVPPVIKEE